MAQLRARLLHVQRACGVEELGGVEAGDAAVGVGLLHMSNPEDMVRELRRLQADNVCLSVQRSTGNIWTVWGRIFGQYGAEYLGRIR